MSLKECPSCGADNIFVPLVPAVGYDGTLYGAKSEGFCNGGACDQRFWYYPSTGRITRRTGGITLREWRQHGVSLDVVNALRANEGMSRLAEAADRAEPCPNPPQTTIRGSDPFRGIKDWYYWLLAAVKLTPFSKRSRKDAAMVTGVSTTNEEVRVEQMLSPAALLPKGETDGQDNINAARARRRTK